jgi:DMSO/TMAO reductase YedYZ heme-binding membrane subunit
MLPPPTPRQLTVIKAVVFALCLIPLGHLVYGIVTDSLGANPIEAVTRGLGDWALRLLLIPLAVTSTNAMMKRLGRNWSRLHRVVYAIGVLAVLHFWWMVKADVREPALYAGILVVLLGLRLMWKAMDNRRAGAVSQPRGYAANRRA